MDIGISSEPKKSNDKRAGFLSRRKSRVLLHEPERCAECNRVYLSLYSLNFCIEHDGLDPLYPVV